MSKLSKNCCMKASNRYTKFLQPVAMDKNSNITYLSSRAGPPFRLNGSLMHKPIDDNKTNATQQKQTPLVFSATLASVFTRPAALKSLTALIYFEFPFTHTQRTVARLPLLPLTDHDDGSGERECRNATW